MSYKEWTKAGYMKLRDELDQCRRRDRELQAAVDLIAEAFNNRSALEALKTPEFTKGLGLCFCLTEKKL